MSGKKRKREGFDEFLKKEIMTQERYDRLYGKQMPDYIGQEESRQAESGDEGAGAVRSEETRMRYEDAQIDERILRAVRELGFEEMTPIQEQAIPLFMTGKDMIGQAQTGRGKSAAFGIPMLQKVDPDIG